MDATKPLIIIPLTLLAVVVVDALSMQGVAFAQAPPSMDSAAISSIQDTNNTIFVTGTATQKVEADTVRVVFAVETIEETAGGALKSNSRAVNAILTALQDAGVAENATSTTYFSIHPNYNYTEFGTQQPIGYTVTNAIMVESFDLSSVPSWIDAAINAGANRIDSLSFTLSEERLDEVRADIIQDALDNARNKAEALTEALDVQVIGVKSATLYDFYGIPVTPFSFPIGAETATDTTRTPIMPGEQTVTVTVGVVYRIG
ncbi:MAG TPA: SIMPL domain-containing protein [Nitrososphaera sp.]|nr:SIMPL domain-containing protein [Nitrososphaera sp.]